MGGVMERLEVLLIGLVLLIAGALAGVLMLVRPPALLVRASQPSFSPSSGRTPASGTPSGDQFFRAIQQALPSGTNSDRYWGGAPWVAFTLTGLPDRPIELGLVVADAKAQRRAETVAALRAIIQGQLLGAQVDETPDPILSTITPGVRVAWREYGLKLPPQYPLRFLDDIAGSDLLGPLASALTPRGVLRTEAQIIVRPAKGWALYWGWRGRATALLLGLGAKADYALAEDAKRVEAKLDAAPFEATIRVVAAAEGLTRMGSSRCSRMGITQYSRKGRQR